MVKSFRVQGILSETYIVQFNLSSESWKLLDKVLIETCEEKYELCCNDIINESMKMKFTSIETIGIW